MAMKNKRNNHLEKIDRELNPETYEHNYKECPSCKQEKPLNKFGVGESKCLTCKSKQSRTSRESNRIMATWMGAKSRAKKSGIEFSITPDDLKAIWTDTCPIYQVPLVFNKGKPSPNSHSLDRINNSKGYVPGNIAIVSMLFNSQKRDLTPEVLKRMLAYILASS